MDVLALIQWQARQIAQLQREVAELKARLNKDSTNSSVPPSASHKRTRWSAPQVATSFPSGLTATWRSQPSCALSCAQSGFASASA